jgi:hypothetical protein
LAEAGARCARSSEHIDECKANIPKRVRKRRLRALNFDARLREFIEPKVKAEILRQLRTVEENACFPRL